MLNVLTIKQKVFAKFFKTLYLKNGSIASITNEVNDNHTNTTTLKHINDELNRLLRDKFKQSLNSEPLTA